MGWPQWLVAAGTALGALGSFVRIARGSKSQGEAYGLILVSTAATAGYCYVLHCGGFW